MNGPLHGLRVVELAATGAVPFAAMMLADAGADVLRVDRPVRQRAADDLVARGREGNAVTRSRRSVVLDLKDPGGVERLLALVGRADVLLEGFRPGVAERLGVGPDDCSEANPGLVYGRLSGWGRDGPLSHRAGHDLNFLALSGTLSAIGPPDRPPPVPLNVVADFGGGATVLAFGVLAAVIEARRTGRGQVVDAAMVDGAAALATYVHSMRAAGTWLDEREANVLDGGAPFYRCYETRDGRYVAVGAIEPQFYTELLAGLGLLDEALPEQLDRTGWPVLRDRIAARFAERTAAEWCDVFDQRDACVTPVLTMAEAPTHPQLSQRGSFVTVAGVVQPAPVPRFGERPPPLPSPPAAAGEGGAAALSAWEVEWTAP